MTATEARPTSASPARQGADDVAEEILRYEAPSPVQARYVMRDVEHHGQRVAQVRQGGEHVLLHEGAGEGHGQRAPCASRMVWASAAMPVLIWSTVAVTNDRRMLRGSAWSA